MLRCDSCHPKRQKKNISYGQFVRLRRICTNYATFRENVECIKKLLVEQKHPELILEGAKRRAAALHHDSSLVPVNRKNERNARTPPTVNNVSNIPIEKKYILHADEKLKQSFTEALCNVSKTQKLGRNAMPVEIYFT